MIFILTIFTSRSINECRFVFYLYLCSKKMNILRGKIDAIKVNGSLSLVRILVGETLLSAIVTDTPASAPYLEIGKTISVIFKETEVFVGKGTEHQISLQNKLVGHITSISKGDLLSKLVMATKAGTVTSIITTNAVNQLQLETGQPVTAMVKTSEMMLSA